MSDRRLATEADLIRHLEAPRVVPIRQIGPESLPNTDLWMFANRTKPEYTGPLTMAYIQAVVADVTKIPINDIRSPRRAAELVRARHIFYYAARNLTSRSFPEIGRITGGRDHSTVIHGIQKVDARRDFFEPHLSIVLQRCSIKKEAA